MLGVLYIKYKRGRITKFSQVGFLYPKHHQKLEN